ncbi:hypothetical protein [Pontibacter fetidus]|uniref:hypothetical protein n=1 Tax=Pontibacter fetidus TaxID=2700082 RepID=UPI0013912430|nr:hypothetical protein [Pontibacter fetidus]
MVEINIEKKKKPVWPWILLLIILGLLVWAIYEFTNDRDNAEAAALPTSGIPATASQVPQNTYPLLT